MKLTREYQQLADLYRLARRDHSAIADASATVQIQAKLMDEAYLVDAVYALKQTQQYLEDSRKEVGRALDLLQKLGCAAVAKKAIDFDAESGGMTANKLSGQWATGHANVTQQPAEPHPERDPAGYHAVMTALGVPPELIVAKTLKPRFDAVADMALRLAEEGKPLPEALKLMKTIPRYVVVAHCRKRGGLDELLENGGA